MTVTKIVSFTSRVLFVVRAWQFCEMVRGAKPAPTRKRLDFQSQVYDMQPYSAQNE